MSKIKSVIVSGNSMGTYLKSGDVLLYEDVNISLEDLRIGELIVLISFKSCLVHRYLGNGVIKGDTNKCIDQVDKIVGVVKYRLNENMCINYDSLFIRYISFFIAYLSRFNVIRRSKLDKLVYISIMIISFQLRLIENTFFSRGSNGTCKSIY